MNNMETEILAKKTLEPAPSEIKVGDVLLNKFYKNNPFVDYEYLYETIKEVRKNDNGEIYFLSYTSDINAQPSLDSDNNAVFVEHHFGKHYYQKDWFFVKNSE